MAESPLRFLDLLQLFSTMSHQLSMTLRPRIRPSEKKRRREETPSDSESKTAAAVRPAPDAGDMNPAQLVILKSFCNFCGDHMGDKHNKCIDCGSCMCEQTVENGPGCIWVGTLDPSEPFRCMVCEPKHWRLQKMLPSGKDGSFPVSIPTLLHVTSTVSEASLPVWLHWIWR